MTCSARHAINFGHYASVRLTGKALPTVFVAASHALKLIFCYAIRYKRIVNSLAIKRGVPENFTLLSRKLTDNNLVRLDDILVRGVTK